MKDIMKEIQYNGETYGLVFNLNVMEEIQKEYGSVMDWGDVSDGKTGEPDAKAVKFGMCAMINEYIDIQNEKNGTNKPFVTLKTVGRMITEIGLMNMTNIMNETVIESTQSAEKNE